MTDTSTTTPPPGPEDEVVDATVVEPKDPVLTVENLSVDFLTDTGWATVVQDVSFRVGAGETVGIVGESGSGKSVSTQAILQLVRGARVRGVARVLTRGAAAELAPTASRIQPQT